MRKSIPRTVLIATGGTIAGVPAPPAGASSAGVLDYRAGVLPPSSLLSGLDAAAAAVETQALAAIDSSDLDPGLWVRLARAVDAALRRRDVAGVVVTHGTDTLEETAYLLHRVVGGWRKPVVLTAAMRPSHAPSPDGPQNLADALAVAREPGAAGVVAVLAGRVIAGGELRKVHGWRVDDAFEAGDAGPVAVVEDGRLRRFRDWPRATAHAAAAVVLGARRVRWPRVEVVASHAGADGALLAAAVAAGARGIVIAGTGNGSVHAALAAAARAAQAGGVVVRRASRCARGGVVGAVRDGELPTAGPLSPWQARVALMLDLMAASAGRAAGAAAPVASRRRVAAASRGPG